jgi:hypothetical protein
MTADDNFSDVGFFNVTGIIITAVVGFLFIFALARTFVFIRKIMFKLRIIMKNSYIIETARFGLPIDNENKSEQYYHKRDVLRKEIIRSWNLRFWNVFSFVLDRYNHLVYWMVWRKSKKSDVYNFLKPQFSFYLMVWFLPFFIVWTLAIFIVGNDLTITAGAAVGFSMLAGLLGSLINTLLTFWFHYFWNK